MKTDNLKISYLILKKFSKKTFNSSLKAFLNTYHFAAAYRLATSFQLMTFQKAAI